MTDEQLREVIRLADEATTGPWKCLSFVMNDQPIYPSDTGKRPIAMAYGWEDCDYSSLKNGLFMAASNPEFVKAMAEELLALREQGCSIEEGAIVIRTKKNPMVERIVTVHHLPPEFVDEPRGPMTIQPKAPPVSRPVERNRC